MTSRITFVKNAWKNNLCTESTLKSYFQKKETYFKIFLNKLL